MNFRSRRTEDPDLNILPLIDVVFLLLIFFMVTTTFDRDSEISITLPEASQDKVDSKPQAVEIDIDREGRVFINARALANAQSATIREALDQAVKASDDRDDPAIIINADAETSHQSVIRVMDAARQLGLRRVTFATRLEQSE
ncbi:biopolymer transport protein ExbD [Methylohalomonas lacus]|uniref:Biopolymer transport protein ExbD n=1 Tax=Methylohalomonas lacus TaxID=398773 RepID=A0AAE3L564_9GAMM|nr:biopolymer transporter ExbD [Methylohalomonas lacus]MCS3902757.1 biopolymer transport protein ExbD [Methylohalomonas lacus]